MPRQLIFWDWTGTLADEAELDRSVCATMELEYARVADISSEEAADFYQRYLKELENTWRWHDYVTHCRDMGIDWEFCQTSNFDKLVPVPGASEVLEYAQSLGFRNVLATNAVRPVIELRLGHVGLEHYFDLVVASDDVQALKSEGKHFLRGLETLEGEAAACYSVGDNPVQDIQPARDLGLRTVFCAYGRALTHYHSDHISRNHREQVPSTFRIEELADIKDILTEDRHG